MDLGFFRRGLPKADHSSDGLDHSLLTASLQAYQSASATARAQARSITTGGVVAPPQDALVEILIGGPRWKEAVDEQGGSFNSASANGAFPRMRGDDA
jgi:hypothetical protein